MSATTSPHAEIEELYSSWSLFIVCLLLILSLLTSYYLQIKRVRAIHETVVSVFAGMFVGLVVRLAPGNQIGEMLTFKHTLFFNLLLPPIILNSGYELRQDFFFRNFGSILTFAFVGTFISAVGLGVIVYVYSSLHLESLSLSFIECLMFGSALSATDPVTILAIFQQYKVDPSLYSIIFGESLLNDAVSIVLYETLSHFKKSDDISLASFFHGVGLFLLSFSSSLVLGVASGLICSLLLKHSSLHLYTRIESCLVALTAYTSYFFSNGLGMSGIVTLLFCGITLKHYAYHTMSLRTQRTTRYLFSVLAQLSENFIFVYLGLNLFTVSTTQSGTASPSTFKPLFILVATIGVVSTRYAVVFPLSNVINLFYRRVVSGGGRNGMPAEDVLPHSYQMMLFWAGLRGAVGVALAAGFEGASAGFLRTAVLAVVLLTVVIFGGTTARMMEIIGIRTGIEDDEAASSDDDGGCPDAPHLHLRRPDLNSLASDNYLDESRSGDSGHSPINLGFPIMRSFSTGRNSPPVFARRVRAALDPDFPGPHGITPSSSGSSDCGELLPLASNAQLEPATELAQTSAQATSEPLWEAHETKWFHTLDERYLLPLFSNATASRSFHARRQARRVRPARREDHAAVGEHPRVAPIALPGADHRRERGLLQLSDLASGSAAPIARPRLDLKETN